MKRYLLALFAVLGLAFIGLSPTKAQAQVPTCTVATGTTFPAGYYYNCGLSSTDNSKALTGLAGIPNNSGSTNTARDKLNASSPRYYYMFAFTNLAAYNAYCTANTTQLPCNTGTPATSANYGFTYNNGGSIYYSIIFETNSGTPLAANILNTTSAHEAGHSLDAAYATTSAYTSAESEGLPFSYALTGASATIAGNPDSHPGELTITFTIPGKATPVPVSINAVGTEEFSTLASEMATAINNNGSLPTYGISAATSGASVLIYSNGIVNTQSGVIAYSFSSPGGNLTMTGKLGDWPTFNTKSPCGTASPPSSGVFSGMVDQSNNPICSGTNGAGNTLSTTYASVGSNYNVLITAWPTIYKDETFSILLGNTLTVAGRRWAELWAEETAIASQQAQTLQPSPDYWINTGNNFPCSLEYLRYQESYGAPLPAYEVGATCPVIP